MFCVMASSPQSAATSHRSLYVGATRGRQLTASHVRDANSSVIVMRCVPALRDDYDEPDEDVGLP